MLHLLQQVQLRNAPLPPLCPLGITFKTKQKKAIPGEFVKWGSLGFFRTSTFATGFTPLQPKPLDSMVDIERAKDRSAEDIASIWDDYHLGQGHIGASMKAKLYRLLEQRAELYCLLEQRAQLYRLLEQRAADCQYNFITCWSKEQQIASILSSLCGEEVVIQRCLFKYRCHTCLSQVLKITRLGVPMHLLTSP